MSDPNTTGSPGLIPSGHGPRDPVTDRMRLFVFISTSVFCVSLLTGVMILMVYYSDKQHAISREDRQRIAEKEARVEGTLIGHGVLLDRIQYRLEQLERRTDLQRGDDRERIDPKPATP